MKKKKVTILVSIAGPDFTYKPGETAFLDAKQADAWAASGVCAISADDPDELRAQIADLTRRLNETTPKK